MDGVALVRALLYTAPALADAILTTFPKLEDVADMVRQYLEADEDGRADIREWAQEGGLNRLTELAQRDRDGTPTTMDLDSWLDSDDGEDPEFR